MLQVFNGMYDGFPETQDLIDKSLVKTCMIKIAWLVQIFFCLFWFYCRWILSLDISLMKHVNILKGGTTSSISMENPY